MSPDNLNSRFIDAIERFAGNVCLVEGERSWTWAEIGIYTRVVAAQISKLEPRPGAPVGLLIPNSSLFAIAFFGCLLAGRVPMPMSLLLKAGEQALQIADSGANLIITVSYFRELMQKTTVELGQANHPIIIYGDEIPMPPPASFLTDAEEWLKSGGLAKACEIDPNSMAVLLYTSGATGQPKGVMLSHANFLANIDAVFQALQVRPTEVFLSALPFFHIFGLMACMILPILSGLKSIVIPRISGDEMLEALDKHQVTILILVPTMYRLLLMSKNISPDPFRAVRIAVSGGSALPPDLVDEFRKITGVEISNGYGATETAPAIALNNPETYSRQGSVGKPLPGVEVKIIDLRDGSPLPIGEKGEICARGPNVFLGYFNKPEKTAEILDAEGWYHTRDLGMLDADGYLFVLGRVDDVIIVAGKNVYPEDIERVLLQHPAVQDAAVVRVSDTLRGQAPAAFIVSKTDPPPSVSDLRAFCSERLAVIQVPREYRFVAQIPRNPLGKILRFLLLRDSGIS